MFYELHSYFTNTKRLNNIIIYMTPLDTNSEAVATQYHPRGSRELYTLLCP